MLYATPTNLKEVIENYYKGVNRIITYVIKAVELSCLKVVENARSLPSPPPTNKPHQPNYIDRTRNLRGSIGYVVYFGNKQVASNFGEESTEGKAFAEDCAKDYLKNQGITAVIVAGMEYAVYVESKGYDVISGSCQELPNILKDCLKQVKKVIDKSKI